MAKKFVPSEAELVWHGDYPQAIVERVRQDIAESLDDHLERASNLVFHTVFLSEDYGSGPAVIVWGKNRDKRLHCEYHAQSEWVSLGETEEPFA